MYTTITGAGVLPAYAGMIPVQTYDADVVACAPRVCGDDPIAPIAVAPPLRRARKPCSPRMRG